MAFPDTTDYTVIQIVLAGVAWAVAILLVSLGAAYLYHLWERRRRRRNRAG